MVKSKNCYCEPNKGSSVIIADEPTGSLDSETSENIFKLFKKLSQDRLIVIVTHDAESAFTMVTASLRLMVKNIRYQSSLTHSENKPSALESTLPFQQY